MFLRATSLCMRPALVCVLQRSAHSDVLSTFRSLSQAVPPSSHATFFTSSFASQSRVTPPTQASKSASSNNSDEQVQHGVNASAASTSSSKALEPESEHEIPQSLPDLTQGIPSTLERELSSAARKSQPATLLGDGDAVAEGVGGDADGKGPKDPTSGAGRVKGELPASAYISSSEKRRQKLANYMFIGALGLGVAGTIYTGRDWDHDDAARHPDIPNGWGVRLWWNRVSARTGELLSYYHEPAFEKLLPDPDPVYGRPYTLCISLEDMLIHSEWTREHGWRIAKRPGVDYFLHYLSQYYELVLFTTVPFAIAEPMVRKLDPFRFIVYPLFREATKYNDGEIVKDLSYLNRDLSKVIIIDTNAAHVRAQPENAIILPKWTGNAKDTQLVALIPFLEYIYTMQYGDVRKVIKSFEGKDIPIEFAKREALARAEFQKQLEAQRKKRPGHGDRLGSGIASLVSMLGLKSSNMSVMTPVDGDTNIAEQLAQGKMLQDIARERGQRTYELMEREIRENGEKWLTEEAAMQEKMQQEAMQSMKQSFTGWFVNSQQPTHETQTTQPSQAVGQPKQ